MIVANKTSARRYRGEDELLLFNDEPPNKACHAVYQTKHQLTTN